MDTLLTVLRDPDSFCQLDLAQWDKLLPQARRLGLLGRFHAHLEQAGTLDRVPAQVLAHLEAARVTADSRHRMLRWEVNRIRRALAGTQIPIVLLKGAAYAYANLPCAPGRLASDVDFMVAKPHLDTVEQALRGHGWRSVKLHEYDQRYYRRWMHELPPMRHTMRGTEVDIHHTILPETGRLRPDPAKLLARAQPVGPEDVRVLCPEDMVLHSAAHGFYDGDLSDSLKDLLDLHDLVRYFASDPDFWPRLVHRAGELNLRLPLFYALRHGRRLLHTPVPQWVASELDRTGPNRAVRVIMDRLVPRALLADAPPRWDQRRAVGLLYIRSHWLRMPPLLLGRHLLHKALRRTQARLAPANQSKG